MNKSILESSFFYGASNSSRTYSDKDLIIIAKDFYFTTETMHTHNFFEFDIIAGGIGKNVTVQGKQPVSRGSLVFGTPANMHSIAVSGSEPMRIFNIQFAGSFERIIIDVFGTFDGFMLELPEKTLDYISDELYEVLSSQNAGQRKLLAHGAAMKVIAAVYEVYREQIKVVPEKSSAKTVFEALLYIRRNFSSDLKLSDVAKHVSFSADYLGKMIKKHTGKSFMRYLLDLRLDNAYLLLTDNELSVKEVCTQVGYSSYTNFYYAFRERFGMNPGDVRKLSFDENAKHFRYTRRDDLAKHNNMD